MTARTIDRTCTDEAGPVTDPSTDPSTGPAVDLLEDAVDPVAVARERIVASALRESPVGPVGLELELHLVDLERPDRRPTWPEVLDLVAALPGLPSRSTVTLEPGGQVELSTPPGADVVAAVAALRRDRAVLREALLALGYGAAPLGTDPARPVSRINPATRYAAMEQHFDALGCAAPGMEMMTATAALQVNLDAGPASGWQERLGLVHALVPVLVAASSTSPYLSGATSGWHSMRQGIWSGIDHGRSDPIEPGEPARAWADYALGAPVMLVRDGASAIPVTHRVPFDQWLRGDGPVDRRPTTADLDYHLTTLFPPVRPRGYLEIRCLDALPDRWWPGMTALVTTLLDELAVRDEAVALCAPVAGSWEAAARDGLSDPAVRRAVVGCAELAARHAPEPLRDEVATLAEMYAAGSSPSAQLRARADEVGPLALLEEEARA